MTVSDCWFQSCSASFDVKIGFSAQENEQVQFYLMIARDCFVRTDTVGVTNGGPSAIVDHNATTTASSTGACLCCYNFNYMAQFLGPNSNSSRPSYFAYQGVSLGF